MRSEVGKLSRALVGEGRSTNKIQLGEAHRFMRGGSESGEKAWWDEATGNGLYGGEPNVINP